MLIMFYSKININPPLNSTNLERQISHRKHFSQTRDKVDLLNLVSDACIQDIETLSEKMDEYIKDKRTVIGFDLRYNTTLIQSENDLSDFEISMRKGWSA